MITEEQIKSLAEKYNLKYDEWEVGYDTEDEELLQIEPPYSGVTVYISETNGLTESCEIIESDSNDECVTVYLNPYWSEIRNCYKTTQKCKVGDVNLLEKLIQQIIKDKKKADENRKINEIEQDFE